MSGAHLLGAVVLEWYAVCLLPVACCKAVPQPGLSRDRSSRQRRACPVSPGGKGNGTPVELDPAVSVLLLPPRTTLAERSPRQEELVWHSFHTAELARLRRCEPVRVTHSIPDCCGMILRSEHGTIVHTGDWNNDVSPLDGDKLDQAAFEEAGAHRPACCAPVMDRHKRSSQSHQPPHRDLGGS